MKGITKWLTGTAAAARIIQIVVAALLGLMAGDAITPGELPPDDVPVVVLPSG